VSRAIALGDLTPLARGGMAELFSATIAGERAVVKVARRDRHGAREALAREAEILARIPVGLGPRLLGTTQLAGRPALAIEWIPWPALRAVAPTAAPEARAELVCRAVARLHGAGVVHADLTPDHVLLDERTGQVRLLDFGVAAPIGAPLPPLATAAYAAPERLAPSCVASPAIDVYALGVVCFELVTGESPFPGEGRERLLGHAARRVPRVAERARGDRARAVSRGLDDAIARAMAKRSDHRPPDAAALAELFAASARAAPPARPAPAAGDPPRAAADASAPATATALAAPGRTRAALIALAWSGGATALAEEVGAARRPPDAHAAIAHREGPRAVIALWGADADGRAAQLASQLTAAGARGVTRGCAEIAIGPRGVPRGAAIIALARQAQAGPEVGPGAPPRPAAAPRELLGRDAALATLERACAAAAGGAPTLVTVWGDPGLGKSRLAAAAAELARRSGFHVVTAAAPDAAALGAAIARPEASVAAPAIAGAPLPTPGALRLAAARALARALHEAPAPIALLIDDAHAADPVALDAIELATLAPAGRLLVVALARPALAVTRPRWGRRATSPVAIELRPLDRDAGRALARAHLPEAAAVPAAALDRLVERAGGVPLYLVELVRAVRAGALRGALATDRLELPEHHAIVAWAVADQLAALAPSAVAAAEALAIAAPALAPAAQTALGDAMVAAGAPLELDLGVAARELAAAGVLAETAGAVRFRHELVREAIAERVDPARRERIHRAVLLAGLATTPAERARHLEGAGERDAAAAAWRAAAAAAEARHDELAAEHALERALACAAPSAELLRRRGAIRARLGRHDAAAADFAAARDHARASGDRGALLDALLDEATALDWALHHADAAACVRAALAAASADSAGEPPLRRARLAMATGRAAWRRGDAAGAIEPCRRALALAAPLGDAGYETAMASRLILGFLLGGRGELDEATALLDEALAEATARGDLQHAAAARCNRYPIHAARGDAAALRADLAAFAAAGRELGVAVTEYRGELYQALVARWCDDDDAALAHARAARRLEEADAALLPRPQAALLLAELAVRAGDGDAAARWHACAGAAPLAGIDAIMHRGLGASLAGQLSLAAATALAHEAIAAGEPEAALQLLELAAVAAERRGASREAAGARAAARALPPRLPRFLTDAPRPAGAELPREPDRSRVASGRPPAAREAAG
jgi:predicted Ser/Thr protein kinase